MDDEDELTTVSNLDLRRAVLGLLLRNGPMTIAQILKGLGAQGIGTRSHLVRSPPRVISDLLGYQRSLGRVRRLGRGRYEVVAEALSPAMRWRCLHWERVTDDPRFR